MADERRPSTTEPTQPTAADRPRDPDAPAPGDTGAETWRRDLDRTLGHDDPRGRDHADPDPEAEAAPWPGPGIDAADRDPEAGRILRPDPERREAERLGAPPPDSATER